MKLKFVSLFRWKWIGKQSKGATSFFELSFWANIYAVKLCYLLNQIRVLLKCCFNGFWRKSLSYDSERWHFCWNRTLIYIKNGKKNQNLSKKLLITDHCTPLPHSIYTKHLKNHNKPPSKYSLIHSRYTYTPKINTNINDNKKCIKQNPMRCIK